ncbi:MAG: hypothetical protein QOK15_692, partial [Nocardioidaceae bacterium]|nr:hypothetical protein [Nocardioidaceae bacterium]
PGQRWHIALKAKDANSSQRLAFDGVTNRHGFLRSRVEFSSGLVTPHFGVVAQNDAGRYCRLRLNPAQIDDATLAPRRLLRVGSAS